MDIDMDMDTDTDRDMDLDMECEMDMDMDMDIDPLSVKSARKYRKNLAGYQQISVECHVHDGAKFKNKCTCSLDAWFIFNLQIKKRRQSEAHIPTAIRLWINTTH